MSNTKTVSNADEDKSDLGAKVVVGIIFGAPVVVGLTNPAIPEFLLTTSGVPITQTTLTVTTLLCIAGPLMVLPPIYTMMKEVDA